MCNPTPISTAPTTLTQPQPQTLEEWAKAAAPVAVAAGSEPFTLDTPAGVPLPDIALALALELDALVREAQSNEQ